jgi:DNA-binding MltR family transcriptional regulator
MARTKTEVEEILKHSRSLLSDISSSTTRTAIIVPAAVLDDLLQLILAARMLKDDKIVHEVLNDQSITFSMRINICYTFGLISRTERRDLHLFRKIRNDAAHAWKRVSLKEQPLFTRVRTLHFAKEFWKGAGVYPRGTKLWFLSGWVILANQLVLRLNQSQHVETAHELSMNVPIVFAGRSAPREMPRRKRLSRLTKA